VKFYDRKDELNALRSSQKASKDSAQFTLLTGRRRVGKTSLVLHALEGQRYLYLFVSRKNERLLCEEFQNEAEKVLGLKVFGSVTRFRDLFEQLLIFAQEKPFTLVIDEFQDFERVDKSIFSEIQNLWDKYKAGAKINLIVSGSIYSLMMKIFENSKEPLFGRATSKITLLPFKPEIMNAIVQDYNPKPVPEDLLCLYMVTGSVPKYISLLMDAGATTYPKMMAYITGVGSPFLTDGKDILVSEFGKDYSTYFSILQLVATGKTSQSEIDSIIGKNTGAYLLNLEKEYSLIEKNKPIFAKPESRNTKWKVSDRYLEFWFRFIYVNQPLIEAGRHDLLRETIEKQYTQYSGLVLEDYFRAKLAAEGRYSRVGSSWNSKGADEIDIVAVNELDKRVLIAEVKRNPRRINQNVLIEKAASLNSHLSGYVVEYRGFSLEDMIVAKA
jgi:AAA+ ATPase superfamily predicted ATPase